MTSIKSVKWSLKDGRQAEAIIEVTRAMINDTAYADGWNVELGKKAYEGLNIKVYVEGAQVASDSFAPSVVIGNQLYSSEFVEKVEKSGGYAVINNKVVLKKEIYDEIMTAIADATSEAEQDEEYKAHVEIMKAKEEAAREAKEMELRETEIPAEAVEAYKHYHGDAEAAWEDENETAWALIRKWTPYIEAQYGIDPEKAARMIKAAAVEARYGIND